MDFKKNLDGHRLSDFSEGALVSCAKGGWMDGRTQKQHSFFTGEMSPKREIKIQKNRKYNNFGGLSSPEMRFFSWVQIARFQ
jgi:hypothetical protein